MRYMLIIKSNAKTEAGEMPDAAFGAAMGAYNQAMMDAGVLVTGEGLQSSAHGARLVLDQNEFKVVPGPFGRPESLIAGFWIIDVPTREAAIEWAKRCPLAVEGSNYADGSGQVEVRPFIVMPDGVDSLAFATPGASDGTRRYLAMIRSDEKIESGEMPPLEVIREMGETMEPLMRQGLLIAADGLQPSSQGARVQFLSGQPVVSDGPFAETKELLGGFAMLRVRSLDEAIELTRQAARIETKWRDQPIEFEIRELFEASDFA